MKTPPFLFLIDLDEKGKVCNYRISNLKEIRSVDERAGRSFTKEELAEIKNAISQKGVMFVAEKLASVRLALTEAGMRLYNGTTFMRPKYKHIERRDDGRYILEFECTPRQIEYYFFKFGESVELLQPSYLREKFRKKYKNAYENHCASQEM
ncbi:MAG: WYL domain-containing protein [Oscillospiraceae bacterium]|nr:WYL domain-containing protein [Oscillospiraceae bacterium]